MGYMQLLNCNESLNRLRKMREKPEGNALNTSEGSNTGENATMMSSFGGGGTGSNGRRARRSNYVPIQDRLKQ